MKHLLTFLLFSFMMSVVHADTRYQYFSPTPGAKMITVNHNIIIRPGASLDVNTVRNDLFSIHGTTSGVHEFRMVISSDNKTIILNPLTPFDYSEEVIVSISNGMKAVDGSGVEEKAFTFETQREYSEAEKENFKSAKDILLKEELKKWQTDTPDEGDSREVEGMFEITVNTNPSPGHIFFDSFSGYGFPSQYTGYTVVSTDGDSLFNKETGFVDDFKLGHNGLFSVYNGSYGRFDVLDSNFNLIDKIYPANGYGMDNHEMQMMPDGHIFIIAQEFQVIDMTIYDPSYYPAATVFGTVIQEFDEKKNLVFEWRAFDHVVITEALHENLASGYIDYMHTNALEIDNDGNILASHRHLDQITKIDRNTGEFIWRLGGVHNEFTFLNGSPKFSYQHDIRRIANGNITFFDNGNWNPTAYSTAKEYHLDEVNKTADLVWSFSHPSNGGGLGFYFAMGSVQRLPNGNTFINWGWRGPVQAASMSEVTPDGEIVWELHLQSNKNMVSYRSHKYVYEPCARPTFNSLRSQNITSNSASLKWKPAWNAVKYKLKYAVAGSGTWNETIVDGSKTYQKIVNLAPASTYLWKIQTWCDESGTFTADYTAINKFVTLPLKATDVVASNSINVYPNPGSDYLMIENPEASLTQVRLINMVGQEIVNQKFDGVENNELIKLSLTDVPSGNYLLELMGDDKKEVRKIILQ